MGGWKTNCIEFVIIISLFIITITESTAYSASEKSPIEVFESTKTTECYQEVSLELGNIWTLCGPYRFKDTNMDRVRLVFVKNAGADRMDKSVVNTFVDLESGEMLGASFPSKDKVGKKIYISTWTVVQEEMLKRKKEREKELKKN